jgi:antitoxin component YwqK of YwqJK toxin-antitoxin module
MKMGINAWGEACQILRKAERRSSRVGGRVGFLTAWLVLFFIATTSWAVKGQTETSEPSNYETVDTTFSFKGEIEKIEFKLNGEVIHRKRFDLQGQILSQVSYDSNGAMSGMNTNWHPNGRKASEGIFDKGKPVGKHLWWREDGSLKSIANCPSGKCILTEYYETGEVWKIEHSNGIFPFYMEERYKNGQAIFKDSLEVYPRPYIEYYPSGKVFRETTKNRQGSFINEYKKWNEDGVLIECGHFKNHDGFRDIKSGEWKYYKGDGNSPIN